MGSALLLFWRAYPKICCRCFCVLYGRAPSRIAVQYPLDGLRRRTEDNEMGTNHDMFRGDLSIRLERRLQTYVDDKKVAGAVAVVAGLEDAFVAAVGTQDMDSATPMGMDTIFRIYSLTKPVTSVAALMLVERGSIPLDDPVADYIPAFADLE